MPRVRTSLYDYKQRKTTKATRDGHEKALGNQDKSWCPHCERVLREGKPTCQWCGKNIKK